MRRFRFKLRCLWKGHRWKLSNSIRWGRTRSAAEICLRCGCLRRMP